MVNSTSFLIITHIYIYMVYNLYSSIMETK